MAQLITIPSLTDPDKLYQVSLIGTGSCSCLDWANRRAPGCAKEGTDCKHIRQARQERAEKLALIAGTVEDHELQRLIEKHRTAGRLDVVFALLCEQWDRWTLAATAPPVAIAAPVKPAALPNDEALRALFA